MVGTGAFLIDVTRTVARAGRLATGIDRVERRWLCHLLDRPEPVFGLVRTRIGYLLVDRRGLAALRDAVEGRRGLPPPDRLSRMLGRRGARGGAETLLRGLAIGRSSPLGLGRLLRRLPGQARYLNLGHLDFDPAVLRTMRRAGVHVTVMVHDTIPLDLPEAVRAETPARFRRFLAGVAGAERIVCPSQVSADGVVRHTGADRARIRVVPLGIDRVEPDPTGLPTDLPPKDPYFVALGTIEGRKDIGLLLDVWEDLGPEAGTLVLCGARGWRVDEVKDRLDAGVTGVIEQPGLGDAAVAALLAGARALLHPSRAEGFGLPPYEALVQGTVPVCADLAIWREGLGDAAVYLPAGDRYAWASAVRKLATGDRRRADPTVTLPDWDSHFAAVLGQE